MGHAETPAFSERKCQRWEPFLIPAAVSFTRPRQPSSSSTPPIIKWILPFTPDQPSPGCISSLSPSPACLHRLWLGVSPFWRSPPWHAQQRPPYTSCRLPTHSPRSSVPRGLTTRSGSSEKQIFLIFSVVIVFPSDTGSFSWRRNWWWRRRSRTSRNPSVIILQPSTGCWSWWTRYPTYCTASWPPPTSEPERGETSLPVSQL